MKKKQQLLLAIGLLLFATTILGVRFFMQQSRKSSTPSDNSVVNEMAAGFLTAVGLGFVYFISAVPAGVAAGAPLWVATFGAWVGYSLGGLAILVAGAPLRNWVLQKCAISNKPDPSKLFWRVWTKFGLFGLGLVAPVTIGPQVTVAVALVLGEKPLRIQLAVSLGVFPWVLLFSGLTAFGHSAISQAAAK